MDSALFLLFVLVLLGWFLVELGIDFTILSDFSAAAPPTFLSPAAAPFAVSTPVVLARDKHDTFVNVAWEERFGVLERVCDPIKGWEWRPKAPEVLADLRAQAEKGTGPLCDPRRRAGAVPVVDPAPCVRSSRAPPPPAPVLSSRPVAPPPAPAPEPAPAPVDNRTVVEMLAGIPKPFAPLVPNRLWTLGGMALAPSATGYAAAVGGSVGHLVAEMPGGYPSSMPVQQQQQQQVWAPHPPPQQTWAPQPPPQPPPQQHFFAARPPPPQTTFLPPRPPTMAPPAAGQPSTLAFSSFAGPAFPPTPTPPRRAAASAPLYDADGTRAPVPAPVKSVVARSSAANAGRVGRKPVPRPSGANAPVLLR